MGSWDEVCLWSGQRKSPEYLPTMGKRGSRGHYALYWVFEQIVVPWDGVWLGCGQRRSGGH